MVHMIITAIHSLCLAWQSLISTQTMSWEKMNCGIKVMLYEMAIDVCFTLLNVSSSQMST